MNTFPKPYCKKYYLRAVEKIKIGYGVSGYMFPLLNIGKFQIGQYRTQHTAE